MKNMGHYLIDAVYLILIVLPLLLIVLLALGHRWSYPALWPTEFNSLSVLIAQLASTEVLTSLGASLALAVGTIVLTLLIAYPTALALAYYQFPGKNGSI